MLEPLVIPVQKASTFKVKRHKGSIALGGMFITVIQKECYFQNTVLEQHDHVVQRPVL